MPLFDFKFKNIMAAELENWPDEEIKKATGWDIAAKEFNKHVRYLFEITFGSPYPISSFSIGAAEVNDNNVHIRLFLFPMDKPRYQGDSIGQIICEFTLNSNSSDMKVWPDFLDTKEIDEEIGKIIMIQWTLRLLGKLKKDNPNNIHFLQNEGEIKRLNLPNNSDDTSKMFFLDDVVPIMEFVKNQISIGNEVAIYFTSKDKGAFIGGKNLRNN